MLQNRTPLLILIIIFLGGIIVGMILNAPVDIPRKSFAGAYANASRSELPGTTGVENSAFTQIAKQVVKSVVTISTEKESKIGGGFDVFIKKFRRSRPEVGIGSGVIIRSDGYILTNNHVIKDVSKIEVKLSDRRNFTAKLVGTDPKTDLAIIRILASDLPVVKFGNSDEIEIGEWVLAVGSPLSLSSTVTAGIISATGRSIDIIDDEGGVENFLQTDAVINPGSSGGALVNMKGEVIGVNTAIATRTGGYQGYGFAVPINIALFVSERLIKVGRVVRGYLGVYIKDVDATHAKAVGLDEIKGVIIETIIEDSPAEKAELEEGDVILKIDRKSLYYRNDLQAYISSMGPGEQVTLEVLREGKTTVKRVVLGSPEESIEVSPKAAKEKLEPVIGNGLGFEVEERAKVGGSKQKGVVISKSSQAAEERNVYAGYVLTQINNAEIRSIGDFQEAVKGLKNGQAIVLHLVDPEYFDSRIITSIEIRR